MKQTSTLFLFRFGKLNLWRGLLLLVCSGIALFGASFLLSTPAGATAGINQQITYQGRLLNNAGATVADGTYNMEFKIYQDGHGCVSTGTSPCGGTLKWTETRTSTNKVTVKNGYFTVQLGSVTPFGSSVDWNQDTLWLSVNIGGTGTPTWDGEMLPFRRMTSTPYSLNSYQLGGRTADQFLQLAPNSVQVDSSTNASIYVNKTGASGNILQLQDSGSDVAVINNSGQTTLKNTTDGAGALQVQDASGNNVLAVNSDTATLSVGRAGVGSQGRIANALTGVYDLAPSVDIQTYNFNRSVPAGHSVVVSVVLSASIVPTVTSITDTKGNTYTLDASHTFGSTATVFVFSSNITTPLTASDTLTIDFNNSFNRWTVNAEEFDNFLTSPTDKTAVNGASSTTSLSSGVTATTTQADEMVFGVFGYAFGTGRTFTPGAGFTAGTQLNTAGGSSDRGHTVEWKTVTATGTQEATATLDTASTYTGAVVTYKTSALGGVDGKAGTIALSDGATGGYSVSLATAELTANRTVTLANESGTICIRSSTSCGFLGTSGTQQTGNINIVSGNIGTTAASIQGASGQTANLLDIKDGAGVSKVTVSALGRVNLQLQPPTGGSSSDGALEIGSTASQGAAEINGVIGFPGYGVGHAQIAYWMSDGFYFCNATSSPSGNYGQCSNRVNLYAKNADFNGIALFKNTSASAFQIQNGSAAKMFVADTSASRIYIGDPTGDTSGVLLVLDTKTNTGDPTGVDGAMYYNNALEQFRCYRDGVWEPCGTKPIDRGWSFDEDFFGGGTSASTNTTSTPGLGNLSWQSATVGTACQAYTYNNNAAPAPSADRPGILKFLTSATATANAGCRVYLGTTTGGTFALGAGQVMKAAVAPGTATAGAVIMRVGMDSQTVTTAGQITTGSGVWWEADPTSNANWRYCYGNTSAAVCANSSVAIAANTMARLEIQITATGAGTSSATFRINGNSSTISSVTISTANLVRPSILCTTGGTATASTACYADYYHLRGDASAAR